MRFENRLRAFYNSTRIDVKVDFVTYFLLLNRCPRRLYVRYGGKYERSDGYIPPTASLKRLVFGFFIQKSMSKSILGSVNRCLSRSYISKN